MNEIYYKTSDVLDLVMFADDMNLHQSIKTLFGTVNRELQK